MIPILGALLGTLAESGLGLLSSAIQAKGKEVVENTLGVKIPDNPTPADVEKLRELQYHHEERLIELGIEKAKMELSSVMESEINLPFITATSEGPKHLDVSLSRAKFQEMTASLVERCKIPFEQAIKDAGQWKDKK